MACDPNTLLGQATCFQCLSPAQMRLAQIALLRRWALVVSPGTDTSPSALLAAGEPYSGLSPAQARMTIIALLCHIST
jgi:hypothetical protein